MGRRRIFTCLEIGAPQQQLIGAIRDSAIPSASGLKLVSTDLLHVTLQFLGSLDSKEVESVLAAVAASTKPDLFLLETGQVGWFPERSTPRVIWLGLKRGITEVQKLHGSLSRNLSEVGFEIDLGKGFTPHITLGRVKDRVRSDDLSRLVNSLQACKTQRFPAVRVPVSHVTVMQSVLGRHGPNYVPVARYPLGTPGPRSHKDEA